MSIHIAIDHLVLEGIPLDVARRPELRAALETELARLITTHGVSRELEAGGSFPTMTRAVLTPPVHGTPTAWGTAVAQSVYGGLQQ